MHVPLCTFHFSLSSRTLARLESPRLWPPALSTTRSWYAHSHIPSLWSVRSGITLFLPFLLYSHICSCRRVMCIRRPSRLWYIQFPALLPITLRCGQPLHQPTATSVRGCCGVLPDRVCAVLSVESNAMRSARTCSMLTVYRVRPFGKISLKLFYTCVFYFMHHFILPLFLS